MIKKLKIFSCIFAGSFLLLFSFITARNLAISAGKPLPLVAVSTANSYTTVAPLIYCNAFLRECTKSPLQQPISIHKKDTIIVSIPQEITSGPWNIYEKYSDCSEKNGKKKIFLKYQYFSPGAATALVLHSTPQHNFVSLEIHAASIIGTKQGILSRAFWYIPINQKTQTA